MIDIWEKKVERILDEHTESIKILHEKIKALENANCELNELLKKHESNQRRMLETIETISDLTDKIIKKLNPIEENVNER